MAFVKGKEVTKYFRKRARELVKGKGRLLTFALVIPDVALPSGSHIEGAIKSYPDLRAYYVALGEDGAPSAQYVEEAI